MKKFQIFSSLCFAFILISLVVLRYFSLSSNVADLGFFITNITSTHSQWQHAFFGHFQPLMLLWSRCYLLFPAEAGPFALIIFQCLFILGSVVAVWRVFGSIPGFAMLMYYPLWVNALFDFHFDHVAIPILTLFFICCERRRFIEATLVAIILVLVKEPFALVVASCGLYFLYLYFYSHEYNFFKKLPYLGLLLILFGFGVFYIEMHWVLPYFSLGFPTSLGSDAFLWLGGDIYSIFWTIITKPFSVISEMFSSIQKLIYLIMIFGLLGFIPLLRPSALIVALPLILISLLSRTDNYYDYANHYTAGLIVPLIVAFRDGLPAASKIFTYVITRFTRWLYNIKQNIEILFKLHSKRTGGIKPYSIKSIKTIFSLWLILFLFVGHWAFASSPVSRLFWSNKVWSYSYQAYLPSARNEVIKDAILKFIPDNPQVSVASQNNLNWGYLASREFFLPFPLGVVTPYKMMDWTNRDFSGFLKFAYTGNMPTVIAHDLYADFVVLDMKRPYFIADKGCNWTYGKCGNKLIESEFQDLVAYTRLHYEVEFEYDGFIIFKRLN
jgi:uncharacterized membrane protein